MWPILPYSGLVCATTGPQALGGHVQEKVRGFGVWGLGFGVWGLGFGVWGLGFGVPEYNTPVAAPIFRVSCLGTGVSYYLRKNPKRMENNTPHISVMRKTISHFLGALERIMDKHRVSRSRDHAPKWPATESAPKFL